jgi:O-antigen/teichoic acid export membrane protein
MGSGARDTAITFFTRLAVLAASLGIQSALAWLLGPSGRGSYAVCILFAMLLGVVFTLSMNSAGQYFVASGRIPTSDCIVATLFTVFVGSVVGVAVGYLLIGSGAEFFTKASTFSFRFSLILVPLNVLSDSLLLLFMGMRRFGRMSRIAVTRVLVHLGATLVLVWGFRLGVPGALAALMLGNFAAVILGVSFLRRGFDFSAARLNLAHCSLMLSYGARYWVANLSNHVNFRIGTIMLAWFVSSAEIGLFEAASGLVARVLMVPDAIEGALLPRVASDPRGRPELVARVARMSLAVCGLILAVLVIASRPLVVVLFSRSFLPVVPLIGIIALGILLRSGSKVLMPYFMGINRPAVCSWAVGLATTVNLGALLILLPTRGLPGAAWAMTGGYVVSTLILAVAFRRASGMGFAETWWPRREDVSFLLNLVKDSMRKPREV